MLAAVAQDGYALAHVSGAFQADREIVLAAVANRGPAAEDADPSALASALAFASDALQADPAVVLAAVKVSGYALEHAWEALQEDAYLRGWDDLSDRGRRNRRFREAFRKYAFAERDACLQAQVDLWLINRGLVDHLSAKKRQRRE